MGLYLNPGNEMFRKITKNHVFVDHSKLIEYTNSMIGSESCFTCVSRPRRFGKSTDANMLVAYYSKGCDSSNLFSSLKISKNEHFEEHRNKHDVIYLNMQHFLSDSNSVAEMIDLITAEISKDFLKQYNIKNEECSLSRFLASMYARNRIGFVFVIDEWDCIFREYKNNVDEQKIYLDFLRNLFKDQPYTELAYMTGILPIKKYGTHSAVNMFNEISVLNCSPLDNFFGFTEEEVKKICFDNEISYQEMKDWYDGYRMTNGEHMYSPLSVTRAVNAKRFANYWTATETYEALKIYIDMNFDGLKEAIISLLAGEEVEVNTNHFQNDMTTFHSKDDVLTIMIHLGYLAFNVDKSTCYIPNREVRSSFMDSIDKNNMSETVMALENSNKLLQATWNQDEEKVAKYIEEAHLETSHLQYNDENALSYTIALAYYTARNYYTMVREFPTGKGFADMVFIPKGDKPAIIVELKRDTNADIAIEQIKEKYYAHGLKKYRNQLLLVGISYDSKTRKHSCKIELCEVM